MPSTCTLAAMWVVAMTGVAGAAQQAAPPSAPAPPTEMQAGDSRLKVYGFIREDVIYDDSRPDAFQAPLFILSEPAGSKDRENFTMHPRLTRVGVDLMGPSLARLGAPRISGKVEVDFQNGGRESRAVPRWRHAYANVAWRRSALLFGQTWDLISPLFPSVNADTLMWNAGNLGDRRPQVRFTLHPPSRGLQWSLAAAAGLTSAVDAQDVDNDTIRDGEAAAAPNLQLRFGIARPVRARRLSAGFWAYGARQQTTAPVGGQTEFTSHAFGADADIPVARFSLRGEAWIGRNLSDIRGGAGQALNRTTGTGIRSRGGWVEFGGDLIGPYAVFAGYTIDAPRESDLPGGGRTRNSAWFLVNRWNAGRPFGIGLDYLRWETRYQGLPRGIDNRFNAYFTYNF